MAVGFKIGKSFSFDWNYSNTVIWSGPKDHIHAPATLSSPPTNLRIKLDIEKMYVSICIM